MLADTILNRVAKTLLDETGDYWPESELIDYLNAAQSFMVVNKPDVSTVDANITTVPGSRQTIPADAFQLLDVLGNANGRAIIQTTRKALDQMDPLWSTRFSNTARHFYFDERNPTVFYLEPASLGGVQVGVLYAKEPTRVVSPTDVLDIRDVYENSLWAITLAMAYAKNTKRGDTAKSDYYFNFASNLLGVKLQTQLSYSPKVEDNQ